MRLLHFLFFSVAHAMFDISCDFTELQDISSSHVKNVYVVRNHYSNFQWNKNFTIENINKTIHSKIIPHMTPANAPTDFKVMKFSDFLTNHLLEHDKKSMEEIMMNDYEERMLFPFENHTHTIFPSLTDGHSCEYMDQYAKKVHKDYFVGAKGTGVNFHQHHEIFNQLVSGKKLWLILDDYTSLNGLMGPDDIIAPKILDLIEMKEIKMCILFPGDIIHVPKDIIHATFNLKTSISSACIASQDSKILYPKHTLNELIEKYMDVDVSR